MSTNLDNSLTKISTSPESFYSNGLNQGALAQQDGGLSATQTRDSQESRPYRVTISEEALRKMGLLKDKSQTGKSGAPAENSSSTSNTQESRELENLKRIDREVRAHEQAHLIAGGSLVRGAASFGYATGPDGKLYAVSGEVSIDTSAVKDDPGATISKMMRVISAALAPAQPSGHDRAVASSAMKAQVEAQQALAQQQMEKLQGGGESAPTDKSNPEKKTVDDPKSASESPLPAGQSNASKPSNYQTKHINVQA